MTPISIDPITLLSQECIRIISEIRKNSRFFQSGVAAILGSSDTINLFNDEFITNFRSLKISGSGDNELHNKHRMMVSSGTGDDPVLGGFLQLKSLLSEVDDLKIIDSLTILQPYFMLISSPSTSGLITSIALNSLSKLLEYNILFKKESIENLPVKVNQLLNSLTHTQFESSDPTLDDSVLLKVLDLTMKIIRDPEYNKYVTNEVFSEVIQINLSLACNKKRSEVLRRYAEQSLNSITVVAFSNLGAGSLTIDNKFYHAYFTSLVSIISVENQYHHTESTKIFVLNLLSTILETSGKQIPQFANLLSVVKNQLFRNLLTIILKNDTLNLLQAALQCFIFLNLILSEHLTLQLEFAYENIFKSILPAQEFYSLDESIDENDHLDPKKKEKPAAKPSRSGTPSQGLIMSRNPLAKELIIESLSLLWSHSSDLLINLFINFDCKFDRKNIGLIFIKFLNKLAESPSAAMTTNNVPPICLEGLIQFINGLNQRVKTLKKEGVDFDAQGFEDNKILKMKARKEQFSKILNILNNTDFKVGILELRKEGYLSPESTPKDDLDRELGEFFYYKANLLNKKNVGEYIAKPKNVPILKSFLSLFNFKGKRVDQSLRLLLQKFRIPGESQQIERVVENFAAKYVEDQDFDEILRVYEEKLKAYEKTKIGDAPVEPVTPDQDAVFILSYAIIMLNTDLHNPKIKEHMKFEEFTKNLKGVYKNGDYPEWYLKQTYNSILNKEIIIPEEHYGTDKWFTGCWDLLIDHSNNSSDDFHFVFEQKIHDPVANEAEYKKISSGGVNVKNIDPVIVSHFDKVLFEYSFSMLIKSFIHVFEETSDDHRVAKLMSTMDKCCTIASYYKSNKILDQILINLARLTTLTGEKNSDVSIDEEFVRDNIPTTQITVKDLYDPEADHRPSSEGLYGNRKHKAGDHSENPASSEGGNVQVVTISDTSTWFGRDFKAQISFIALFNIIRKSDMNTLSTSWKKILVILLKLYENSLIDGNFFSDFQKKHSLDQIPKIKPRYVIDNSKAKTAEDTDVSIFSAFTSYLKINMDEPPEPSNEEIESTLSTLTCIKSAKVRHLFEDTKICSKELTNSLLSVIPTNPGAGFQNKVIFLIETVVGILDQSGWKDEASKVKVIRQVDRILVMNEKNNKKLVKEDAVMRLLTYQLICLSELEEKFDEVSVILKRSIHLLLAASKEAIEQHSASLISEICSVISSDSWKGDFVVAFEDYWRVLRRIASFPQFVTKIYDFMESLVREHGHRVLPDNYMMVLGLFDEVSSAGAIGSSYEQEVELGEKPKLPDANPSQGLIEVSIKSIDLTVELKAIISGEEFKAYEKKSEVSCWYALVQALGHQTLNPCRQVRSHALKVFTSTLLTLDVQQLPFLNAKGIFELDVFPLISELMKDEVVYCDYFGLKKTKLDILSNITKIYLQYLNKFYILKEEQYTENSELSFIWLTLLEVFKNLIQDESKQIEFQLKNKKKFPMITKQKNELIIKEASKELIKNSLLYMEGCEYLKFGHKGHEYIWSETWKRIGEMYPGLKAEFVAELKEIKGDGDKEKEEQEKEEKEGKEQEKHEKEEKQEEK